MLNKSTIDSRLNEMRQNPAPLIRWDETCEGSGRALVVFVGPSPGGKKSGGRRPMNKACFSPLWDEPFMEPLSWSPGFRISFQPLVEALFQPPYATASKLIARANLDWLGNPESKDVAKQFMFEGAPSTLQLLEDCSPELVLPMDLKTFLVLKEVMVTAGFVIAECSVKNFSVRISDASERYHRKLHAYFAATPGGRTMLVMKLPQHPARIFQADYATRCGAALRVAAIELCAEHDTNMPRATAETLSRIEHHFHALIRERTAELVNGCPTLYPPSLSQSTPTSEETRAWFSVPGMYGGFAYWLDLSGKRPKLVTESWCRVVEGSGQRHEVDVNGSKLTSQGFV